LVDIYLCCFRKIISIVFVDDEREFLYE